MELRHKYVISTALNNEFEDNDKLNSFICLFVEALVINFIIFLILQSDLRSDFKRFLTHCL